MNTYRRVYFTFTMHAYVVCSNKWKVYDFNAIGSYTHIEALYILLIHLVPWLERKVENVNLASSGL